MNPGFDADHYRRRSPAALSRVPAAAAAGAYLISATPNDAADAQRYTVHVTFRRGADTAAHLQAFFHYQWLAKVRNTPQPMGALQLVTDVFIPTLTLSPAPHGPARGGHGGRR
jgi:hypothetical protein